MTERLARENLKCREELSRLQKLEINRYCADCGQKQASWCSTNIGVFVCIRCSGVHRNLGVHISKVKSSTLDGWTKQLLDHFKMQGGNEIVNSIYEAKMPRDAKPNSNTSVYELEKFIRDKYERKLWYSEKKSQKWKKKLTEEKNSSKKETEQEENENENNLKSKQKNSLNHKKQELESDSTASSLSTQEKERPPDLLTFDHGKSGQDKAKETKELGSSQQYNKGWMKFGDDNDSIVIQPTTNEDAADWLQSVIVNDDVQSSKSNDLFDKSDTPTNGTFGTTQEQKQKKAEQSKNSILEKFKEINPNLVVPQHQHVMPTQGLITQFPFPSGCLLK
ncbi:Arf GTPase activating protein [Reticulomyxa filosa]|uniref:Arf GTPase activating protein n=1 Tax=Reticulomyxa filosa TaxID=46433 RepID=X6M5S2_RETFI|nr:Arf GTPase activating protein [Reticulomyxa filosa]|eukprot:ETO08971.1 Arf GTPase activating protein [Reticulomyxa filosa]